MQTNNSDNNNESWMNKRWRPLMGYMYMAVCVFDFIIFPILWAVVQFWETSAANDAFRQWSPLTLQGAGLFHMAMGAVLGITAFGRTKEKIEGVSGGLPTPSIPSSVSAPAPVAPAPVQSFTPAPAAPVSNSFSAAPANQFTTSGKKIVPQDPDPEI